MLEDVTELTLDLLNEATQAWAEMEYNRKVHSEIGTTPLRRSLEDRSVLRDSPSSEALRRAFRMTVARTQRRSDGTIAVEGARFEVPSRWRHLDRLLVRYARWDLRTLDLVDVRTSAVLGVLYPLDKTRNADGRRRSLEPAAPAAAAAPSGEVAPLLKDLMAQYSATGLPPAYLPKENR